MTSHTQRSQEERQAKIVAALNLSDIERRRLLNWMGGIIESVRHLYNEKRDHLTNKQLENLLLEIENAAKSLQKLLEELGSGPMISHELSLLLPQELREARLMQEFAAADGRVKRDFNAVGLLRARALAMRKSSIKSEWTSQPNATRPDVAWLTDEITRYWSRHIEKSSQVTLNAFAHAIFECAGFETDRRHTARRLQKSKARRRQKNSKSGKIAGLSSTPPTAKELRKRLINEFVRWGYDEESATEMAASPKYQNIDASFDFQAAAKGEHDLDR